MEEEILLCRSEKFDLCKREQCALNEWSNSFMFLMTARLLWRQRGKLGEASQMRRARGGQCPVSTEERHRDYY